MCVCVCVCVVCVCVCVCVCACVRACVSLASDSSEIIEVIIITLGTVTASDMLMHHNANASRVNYSFKVAHLNQEYDASLIISETIQAMPTRFAVKIVRLKVYIWPLPVRYNLALHSK